MSKQEKTLRLDKYLADLSVGTRSEVKQYIKRGRVVVNDTVVTIPDTKIQPEKDVVCFDGQNLNYVHLEYYMLHKPAGVVSATSDKFTKTVVDLIEDANRKDLFPVGRLDKDTEGLLLITNDGDLAHQLLSPKKHVDKVYYAKVAGFVTKEDEQKFQEGLLVDEQLTAMPAKLQIIQSGDESEILLTIREGKFHQVKRMFEAVGKEVTYLKRISMGPIMLDESLAIGEYRELTKEEIELLRGYRKD